MWLDIFLEAKSFSLLGSPTFFKYLKSTITNTHRVKILTNKVLAGKIEAILTFDN
jgi:hypothetical protein